MGIFARQKELEERRKKAIPSQVFYNHFFAIYYHLNCQTDRFDLKKTPFFNNLKLRNVDFEIDNIRKLLWNSWSTEYAFILTSTVDNDEYYKFALHWNFPQAYYSIYLSMTAFHETQGVANEQHEKSIKLFGNSVKDGHYPQAISFFCKGLHESFEYKGLSTFANFPKDYSALSRVNSLDEAQMHIASFLKSTRKKNAENKREKARINNDKRFLNAKSEFRKSFSKAHWDLIYQTIPETTIFNIMYRLRIKANYHDVETFINADIDFKAFHNCLSGIIDYLNYIHEAYVYKVIGKQEYEKILNSFPTHLNKETACRRYQTIIEKT
jgi:hypothetical protein